MASFDSQVLGLFADPNVVQERVTQEINQQMPSGLTFLPAQTLFQGLSPISAALDPRTRNARTIQETAQETPGEFGTSAYYQDLANRLNAKGMTQAAMALQTKAKEMTDKKIAAATAEFGKISPKDYGSYTVPIVSLINQYSQLPAGPQRDEVYLKIQGAMQKGRAEVQTADVNDASKIARAQEEATQAVRNKAELMKSLGEDRKKADQGSYTLQAIKDQIVIPVQNNEIMTGPLASYRASLLAFGRVLFPGLRNDEELSRRIGNTQAAAYVIGDQLLAAIDALGTNPSNADREFIQQMLPEISRDPAAIQKIYDYMSEKQMYVLEELNARQAHLQNNDDLSNYKAPASSRLEAMLRAEGIDISAENMQPNQRVLREGVRDLQNIPVVEEDLSGPQINRMRALENSKGSRKKSALFLIEKLRQGTATEDEKAILRLYRSLGL